MYLFRKANEIILRAIKMSSILAVVLRFKDNFPYTDQQGRSSVNIVSYTLPPVKHGNHHTTSHLANHDITERRVLCLKSNSLFFQQMSQQAKRTAVMGCMTQSERTLVFNLPNDVISLMLGVSADGPRRSTITHLIESWGVKVQYEDSRSLHFIFNTIVLSAICFFYQQ